MSLSSPTQGEVKEFLADLPDDFNLTESIEVWKSKRFGSFSPSHEQFYMIALLSKMHDKKIIQKYVSGKSMPKNDLPLTSLLWRYRKLTK